MQDSIADSMKRKAVAAEAEEPGAIWIANVELQQPWRPQRRGCVHCHMRQKHQRSALVARWWRRCCYCSRYLDQPQHGHCMATGSIAPLLEDGG